MHSKRNPVSTGQRPEAGGIRAMHYTHAQISYIVE